MGAIKSLITTTNGWFNNTGEWLSMFGLRLLLAYEFGEAGIEKFNGSNWFGQMGDDFFPFPFNLLSADVSWFLSMWTEIIAAALLVIGFGTRYAAISLIILDLVAWASVHTGGYTISNNGFKLPLMYLIIFIPLVLSGPGKLSIDHFIKTKFS